ncbi:hypothetical protein SS50377_22339 [Spironucleus salmonicida]|uniref:Uncharacterized protein n=1 Tax=Spironucleus salmonicida TaxID=348837 RepID=V6LER8_9EUKA|nr:hypothetical protein SS50377_22339 [Spironucleus salmonicida]|eukprot:EST42166.1 Hypothetical protein SS50377_18474 [Spironucleus salmonicida]
MHQVNQDHKIYYKFAFDRSSTFEIKIPMGHSIKLAFLHQFIIAKHAFAPNARAVLEFALEGMETQRLRFDTDIDINQTLVIFRVPSAHHVDILQKIIRAWENAETGLSSEEAAALGVDIEEIKEIIKANTETDFQKFIEEMKQRHLIDERQFQQQENIQHMHNTRSTRGGKQKKKIRDDEIDDESSSSSDQRVLDAKDLCDKLYSKTDICGQWFDSGKCYREDKAKKSRK